MRIILRDPKRLVPLSIIALFFLTLYINSSPCALKVILYPVYREIKKECLIAGSSGLKILETDNYKIHYKSVKEEYMDIIKEDAEKSLKDVLNDFDYSINEKINIIVYSDYMDMADNIGLGKGTAAMGVYYGGTISILDPSRWINSSEDIKKVFASQGPMVHELTHYIVDYMSGGNVPVWFTEGVALYEEYRINNIEWGQNKKYNKFYDLKELEGGFYSLDEVKAYRQSLLAVKYIGDNFGMEALMEIINKLGAGKTMNQAAEQVIGMSADELFKKAFSYN